MSGAPNRVKTDRHMTIVWSGGFMTLTDTGASCEECQPSFKVPQFLDATKSRVCGIKAAWVSDPREAKKIFRDGACTRPKLPNALLSVAAVACEWSPPEAVVRAAQMG